MMKYEIKSKVKFNPESYYITYDDFTIHKEPTKEFDGCSNECFQIYSIIASYFNVKKINPKKLGISQQRIDCIIKSWIINHSQNYLITKINNLYSLSSKYNLHFLNIDKLNFENRFIKIFLKKLIVNIILKINKQIENEKLNLFILYENIEKLKSINYELCIFKTDFEEDNKIIDDIINNIINTCQIDLNEMSNNISKYIKLNYIGKIGDCDQLIPLKKFEDLEIFDVYIINKCLENLKTAKQNLLKKRNEKIEDEIGRFNIILKDIDNIFLDTEKTCYNNLICNDKNCCQNFKASKKIKYTASLLRSSCRDYTISLSLSQEKYLDKIINFLESVLLNIEYNNVWSEFKEISI